MSVANFHVVILANPRPSVSDCLRSVALMQAALGFGGSGFGATVSLFLAICPLQMQG